MNKLSPGAGPRREEILRLVRATAVRSQKEIIVHLRRRGFRVTQPTLSRDLRELGLAKTPAGYLVPESLRATGAAAAAGGGALAVTPLTAAAGREARMRQALRGSVVSVEAAGSLVVLRTPPAAAQPVARALDDARPEGAVGTIGGDDTIFLAACTTAAARRIVRHIRSIIRAPRPARPRRG